MYKGRRKQRLSRQQHTTTTGVTWPSFSLPGHQRFDGGLEVTGVGTPAAAASACSRLRTMGDESRIE